MQAGFGAMATSRLPIIAAIDGWCIGAGIEMAAACDIRIASSRARFAVSPAKLGLSYHPDELRRIHQVVQAHEGVTIVDEIYLGLGYDDAFAQTALAIDENIISINSFSKYFNMTGWRLGWMVVPDAMVPVVERLAQNLFICASTVSQQAALACFEAESIAEYERRRAEFKARRDWFIPALNAMGLTVPVVPDGAFYAWADCSAACQKLGVKDSWDFAFDVMQRAHVAVTPGRDFGQSRRLGLEGSAGVVEAGFVGFFGRSGKGSVHLIGFDFDFDVVDESAELFPDAVHQLLGHRVALVLVRDERIDLGESAQVNAFAEVIHVIEMLAPA